MQRLFATRARHLGIVRDDSLNPTFENFPSGRLFCLRVSPRNQARQPPLVAFVPPFAEEMNKSRKMMALAAARLAENGFETVVFDLYGTGDSGGDFGDADWSRWRANLADVLSAFTTERDDRPLQLIALRTGALLANDAIHRGAGRWREAIRAVHYWQPVFNASQYIVQFLRMRLASRLTREGRGAETLEALRSELDATGELDVAGYRLSAALVEQMEQAEPSLPTTPDGPRAWIYEISRQPELTPGMAKAVARAARDGAPYEAVCVAGDKFWSTLEITLCPALIEATISNALIAAGRQP